MLGRVSVSTDMMEISFCGTCRTFLRKSWRDPLGCNAVSWTVPIPTAKKPVPQPTISLGRSRTWYSVNMSRFGQTWHAAPESKIQSYLPNREVWFGGVLRAFLIRGDGMKRFRLITLVATGHFEVGNGGRSCGRNGIGRACLDHNRTPELQIV